VEGVGVNLLQMVEIGQRVLNSFDGGRGRVGEGECVGREGMYTNANGREVRMERQKSHVTYFDGTLTTDLDLLEALEWDRGERFLVACLRVLRGSMSVNTEPSILLLGVEHSSWFTSVILAVCTNLLCIGPMQCR